MGNVHKEALDCLHTSQPDHFVTLFVHYTCKEEHFLNGDFKFVGTCSYLFRNHALLTVFFYLKKN